MILLDTHVWIWWTQDSTQLSPLAKTTIDAAIADRGLWISSISTWEIALLVHKGRLELTMDVEDWVAHTEALPFVTFIPVSNRIALKSVSLPIHPDPADRLIIATAMSLGSTIVTKDERIRSFEPVQTIW